MTSGELAWAAPAGPPGAGGVVSLACGAARPGDAIFASCAGGRGVRALRPADGAPAPGVATPAAATRTAPAALAAAAAATAGAPGGALAVGTTGLSLFDPASGRRAGRLAGHGGAVTSLAWAPGGAALVSAGTGDRAAAVWTLAPAGAGAPPSRTAPPAALLALDGGACPTALSTSAAPSPSPSPASVSFRVVALADTGVAARVWEVRAAPAPLPSASTAGGGEAAPVLPVGVAHLADISPPGGPRTGAGGTGAARLLAVGLVAEGGALLVAAGAPGAPSIHRLALPAEAPPTPLALTVGEGSGGKAGAAAASVAAVAAAPLVTGGGAATPAAKKGRAAAAVANGVAVLEPGAAGGPAKAGVAPAKRGRKAPGGGGAGEHGTGNGTAAAAAAAITTPPPVANGVAAASDEEEEGEEEEEEAAGGAPTLGDRLAALGVAAGPARAAADADDLLAGPAPPRAGTLATLLSQALRAEDAALLERCLTAGGASGGRRRRGGARGGPSPLTATVAALAPSDAGALLRALVSRLRCRASRGGALAPWLAATLHCHAAYLVAAPGAARPLADLCDALAARSAAAPALSGLAGRLDLLLAQAGGGAAAARDAAAAAAGGVLPGGCGDGEGEDDGGGYRESDDDAAAAGDDLSGGSSSDDGDDLDDEDGEWATDDEADEDDDGDDDDGMEF